MELTYLERPHRVSHEGELCTRPAASHSRRPERLQTQGALISKRSTAQAGPAGLGIGVVPGQLYRSALYRCAIGLGPVSAGELQLTSWRLNLPALLLGLHQLAMRKRENLLRWGLDRHDRHMLSQQAQSLAACRQLQHTDIAG